MRSFAWARPLLKGAAQLLQSLEASYGVKSGQTTPDGKLSILTARCLGACGLAPAVVLDGTVHGKVSGEDMLSRVAKQVSQ